MTMGQETPTGIVSTAGFDGQVRLAGEATVGPREPEVLPREIRKPYVPFAEGSRAGRVWADFWTRCLFWAAPRFPRLMQAAKSLFLWFAVRSESVFAGPASNARRIFQRELGPKEERAFARQVVGSMYDFILDIGRSAAYGRDDFLRQIEAIDNREAYIKARAAGKGAVVVTAHMGSFEVGVAALAEHEKRIHVVFKRDVNGHFERMRQQLRRRLGVIETALDEDANAWMRLRDALQADEIIVIQGDRVMGGQKGLRVAFLGGHLLLPTGPAKLALASGAPLIPVFALRTPGGRIRIRIEEPIWLSEALPVADAVAEAVQRWTRILERVVSEHPEQWLLLRPAFCEDAPLG